MKELVILKQNEIFTDSLMIAEGTGNQHNTVQRLIQKYENDFSEFGKVRFEIIPSKSGQNQKVYLLNEEQATLLLTYMKNTNKIRQFKKNLVSEFYKMRMFILEKQSEAWQESRKAGKITRQSETDIIKQLVEYAKTQGSEHSQKLYTTYSKLANKMTGIKSRELATIAQLNQLTFIENIILNQIRVGMERQEHYKEIYKNCKKQIELFKDIAYIGGVSCG